MNDKARVGNTTTYNWDFESNLTSIDFPNTANDDTHEYDGAARRTRSKLDGASNWTNFVWDEVAGTLLAEYTLISSTYLIKSENNWGLGLISTNRESTKRFFHFDGDGNTIALTNTSESVTDTYGYAAGGVPVASEDSGASVNPFRWGGEGGTYDWDSMGSVSGLIHFCRVFWRPEVGHQINHTSGAAPLRQTSGPLQEYFEGLFPPSNVAPWAYGLPIPRPSWCYFGILDWGYGNCCGMSRKCGSNSKVFDCTDASCRAHDMCVGSEWPGLAKWRACNQKFCNDIRYCWNQHCVNNPIDVKQCYAIGDIASIFCNSFCGGPPSFGQIWH